jgi:death-on-curing protein
VARLWYPTRQDVETLAYRLAAKLFDEYDSSLPAFTLFGGERQGGALLDSALALPRQTFDGRPLYRTVHDKAGVLLRSLIKNHPLLDGNKRLALATVALFLLMNGHLLLSPTKEMVEFALEVARSEPDMDWREISKWIRSHTIRVHDVRATLEQVREAFAGDAQLLARVTDRWGDIASFITEG